MEHPFAPLPAIEPDSEACWTACREGRLEMARCRACRWFVHPARPVCPRCRSRDVAARAAVGARHRRHLHREPPALDARARGAVRRSPSSSWSSSANLRLTTNIVGCRARRGARRHAGQGDASAKVTDEVALPLFEPDAAPRADPATLRTTPERRRSAPTPRRCWRARPAAWAPEERLERRAILSGVGQSAIGRRLFRTDMDLTFEAALRAIADAGLTPDDIDGIASLSRADGRRAGGLRRPGHRRRAGRARPVGELAPGGAGGARRRSRP